MTTKPFYNHIAGLRGLAIVLIFLFHLNSAYFPHGFYGVDMFLVITGYLLFLSFARNGNQLDIKTFVTKKLLRIFPPMIILVLAAFLAAMYFQDCEDLVDTARTGRYTLFGFANAYLNRHQNDYFAAEALTKPMLHMWYLSVTIHLYVLFAIGCVVYRFIPRKLTLCLLWIIGIASFCYAYSFQFHNILQALGLPVWEQHMAVSHYLTIPRIWTLLAGGAILILPSFHNNKTIYTILSVLGLAAALLPALANHELADYGAPFVVLGTMLIIRYLPESIFLPVLDNKPLLWIGAISFSLYLVHMPIIAFFHIWYQGISGWGDYASVTVLALVIGWGFWYLIEKRKINIFYTLALWAITMGLCVIGKELDGFKDYLRPEINSIQVTPYNEWQQCAPGTLANAFDQKNLQKNDSFVELANTSRKLPKTEALLLQMGPASQTPKILLIGDSFAQASYFGLNKTCADLNQPGAFLCSTIIPFWDYEYHVTSSYYFDQKKGEALMKWIEANPCITHVFISQYWRARHISKSFKHWDKSIEPMTDELWYQSLRDFVKRIHDMKRHVIIIGTGPEITCASPTRHVRIATRKGKGAMDMAPLTCTRQEVDKINAPVNSLLQKLADEGLCTLLDSCAILPQDKPFISYQNNTFLMYDGTHLSSDGSIRLFEILKPQIEKALQQPAPEQ